MSKNVGQRAAEQVRNAADIIKASDQYADGNPWCVRELVDQLETLAEITEDLLRE